MVVVEKYKLQWLLVIVISICRYYCPGGNSVKDPHQFFCTIGHFCPGGTSEPIPCQNNSFAKATHAKECSLCPAGFFCKIAGVPKNCTRGYYCPYGTGIDLKPCPKGTYGAQETLERVSQCKSCDPGKYCAYEHATNYTDECDPGHWCAYGVDRPDPIGDNITVYNASSGNDSCPHYDGRETGYGGICPIGHYCPRGSKAPLLCPAGKYCPVPKLSDGLTCVEGYYCPGNNSEYESRPCPQGYFCPNGTSQPYQFPCPPGTYNNRTRRTRIDDCVSCSPGFYCPVEGMFANMLNAVAVSWFKDNKHAAYSMSYSVKCPSVWESKTWKSKTLNSLVVSQLWGESPSLKLSTPNT